MAPALTLDEPVAVAAAFDAEINALPVKRTPAMRPICQKYTLLLAFAPPAFVFDVVYTLIRDYGHRGLAYALLAHHREAFARIGAPELAALGEGIDSWQAVDGFSRLLAGPAWLRGQVADAVIHRWARAEDRWWRRAALVSTVALNMRSHGGMGDVDRTLAVCRLLAGDHDDMVVKALSWALRALVVHDAGAVRAFVTEYEDVLAARVKREVRHKLDTGLKSPRRK